MVHLTTVGNAFHGRVVMARLGADGILAELRGAVGATYPLAGLVEVYVDAEEAEAAHQLLLADADAVADTDCYAGSESPLRLDADGRPHAPWAWLVLAALVLVTTLTYALGA